MAQELLVAPTPLTLHGLLDMRARSYPHHVAAVTRQERLTYPQLAERVRHVAAGLAACGVGAGDRVLWLGQNHHRVLELLMACGRLGAMVCPANWRQSVDELVEIVQDLEPTVIVWQREQLADTVQAVREKVGEDGVRWVCHDAQPEDADGYERVLGSAVLGDHAVATDPDAPVLILYTAAFSGRPGGSMLSHANLITQGVQLLPLYEIDDAFAYLNVGPLFHIGTFQVTVSTFIAGGKNVFTYRADPPEVLSAIVDERCVSGMVLGPTITAIVELNAGRTHDISHFRTMFPTSMWHEMVSPDTSPFGRAPAGYGQTEVTGFCCYGAFGGRAGVSNAGRPAPVALVRLVDPAGVEVPDGQIGEICVAGPLVHRGYWRRPEINAERFRDGWWYTRDLGRREHDGVIQFVGTAMRMLKSGVENIYPAEVESCLLAHPAVREAAVIGIPDDRWIQSVLAVVVLEPGQLATEQEIVEHCKQRIASYKKPARVEFVDALPRSGPATDYATLDERFGGGGYPGGLTRSSS